jgi:hypothetical protein
MEQISVRTTTEGNIEISQYDPHNHDPTLIVPPEQADVLIQWIEEARDELQQESN